MFREFSDKYDFFSELGDSNILFSFFFTLFGEQSFTQHITGIKIAQIIYQNVLEILSFFFCST